MSLLGFGAIGRFSLGQLPRSSSIALPAAAGSYALTGQAALFKISEAAVAGNYSQTGTAIAFKVSLGAVAGSYAVSGVAAPFSSVLNPVAGSYAVSGVSATFAEVWRISAGSYAVTGNPTTDGISEAAASGSYVINATSQSFPYSGGGLLGFGAIGQISVPRATVTSFAINEIAGGASYVIVPVNPILTRTGFDYDFQQGGVGHLLYEIEEAKRLAAITKRGPPGFVDLRSAPTFPSFGGQPSAPPAPPIDLQAIAAQRAQMQAQKRRREAEAVLLLAS